jgi:hypothetical protein
VNPTGKDPLQKKIDLRNWIGFGTLLILSFAFMSSNFTLGIFLGGLISIANYHWLYLSLRKSFRRMSAGIKAGIMIRYYIRLAVTGAALFFIITRVKSVDIIGLLIGLSIVVINITVSAIIEVAKGRILKNKEVN